MTTPVAPARSSRRRWSRWLRWLGLVLLLLGSALLTTLQRAPRTTEAQSTDAVLSTGMRSDPTDPTILGFIDQTGAYLVVALTPGEADYGMFNVAIQGVGLFLSSAPAQVSITGTTAHLSYSGAGFLDAGATLDLELVYGTRSSGQMSAITLQMTADVDLAQHTGTAHLTANGQSYALVIAAPTVTADGVLAQVLTALPQQDWAGLYALADRRLRSGIAQADFIAQCTADQQAVGTVTGVRVLVAPTYGVVEWGFQTADALLEVTLSKNGVSAIRWLSVQFTYDGGAWRFTTFLPLVADQLIVVAGGPYTVAAGQSVTLSATAFNPNNETLTFAWDLDHDGSFETSGQQALFSTAGLAAPATRAVTVRVTSSSGATSTGEGSVTVTGATPGATRRVSSGTLVNGDGYGPVP